MAAAWLAVFNTILFFTQLQLVGTISTWPNVPLGWPPVVIIYIVNDKNFESKTRNSPDYTNDSSKALKTAAAPAWHVNMQLRQQHHQMQTSKCKCFCATGLSPLPSSTISLQPMVACYFLRFTCPIKGFMSHWLCLCIFKHITIWVAPVIQHHSTSPGCFIVLH